MNPFKTLFLAHAPDADKDRHHSRIDTGKYRLDVVIVKSQAEAIEVSRSMVRDEGVESILLCPGFTHRDIAELVAATEGRAAVCVARGDGPSNRISMDALRRAGFF